LSAAAFVEIRAALFIWIGLPAVLVLLAAGGVLGALTSGMVRTDGGTRLLLGVVNGAFLVVAVVCGACSPIARRWRMAVAAFLARDHRSGRPRLSCRCCPGCYSLHPAEP